MKVIIANTACVAELDKEGFKATWSLPPNFTPELDRKLVNELREFCDVITADHNQEKELSGFSPGLSLQINLDSLAERPTTAQFERLGPVFFRGRVTVDISGEGLNNFYFLSEHSCQLLVQADVYTFNERGVTSASPAPWRQLIEADLSHIRDYADFPGLQYKGKVAANDIPVEFDKVNKLVSCSMVDTVASDDVWMMFSRHTNSGAGGPLQCILRITLTLEVDNYHIPPLPLSQVISDCDNYQDEIDFVIKSGDDGIFHCHKRILAEHSDIFEIAAYGTFHEGHTNTMIMPTFDAREVEAFLKFLYTGDVTGPSLDPDLAIRLMEIGHMYGVERIEREMINLILTKPMHWLKASNGGATLIDLCLYANYMSTINGWRILCHALDVVLKYRHEMMRCERYKELFRQYPKAGAELAALLVKRASKRF